MHVFLQFALPRVLTAALERGSHQSHAPLLAVLVVAKSKVVVYVGEPGLPFAIGYGSGLEGRPRWRDGESPLWINIDEQYRGIPTTFIMHRNVDEEA